MKKENAPRFLYRAQGLCVGGFLDTPTPKLIKSRGQVSLPITGGYGCTRFKDFKQRGISIGSGYSLVSGHLSRTGNSYQTVVTSVVENLSVLGIITAGRVVARIASSHPNQDRSNPTITSVGSHFQELRICGREMKFGRFFDGHAEDAPILDRPGAREKGFTLHSLVEGIRSDEPQHSKEPNRIDIPDFGSVYLAELIVSAQTKRLTMLRIELGCAIEGDVTVCSVEGDGHRMP